MTNEKTRILLVEDDKNLGYVLSEYLKIHNYVVTLAANGGEALKAFNQIAFDICVLDIMMPIMDGYTVARRIREKNHLTPIIFLTAKQLKIDKLKAFKLGADDYITKPVDEEELIARIEAILRRTNVFSATANEKSTFKIAGTVFDFLNQKLTYQGTVKNLTTKESDILREFCLNPGNIVSRQFILNKYWGCNDYFNRKSMDVFIYKIRKHLAPNDKISINNVHGKGFILKVRDSD